jgi:hypothetical protein
MNTVAEKELLVDELVHSAFSRDIRQFNTMYRLPYQDNPTFSGVGDPGKRLTAFKKTILDEIKEVDEILEALNAEPTEEVKVKILTMIADWLGDIQVYAASEIRKYGLDNDKVLEIIMRSNFSKQNADGTTTYDAHGKVQKGPNYYKPEPEIESYIRAARDAAFAVGNAPTDAPEPASTRMSHALDGRQVTTRVILDVTHDRALTNVAEFAAQRIYTLDKVTGVDLPTDAPLITTIALDPAIQKQP